jgi:AcrR family transcriptional regulator
MAQTSATRRSAQRRRRGEAKQQILDTARGRLQTTPFRDLSIDDLMEGTGLSRTAFYRYFPDREAVLIELLEEVWGALAQARDLVAPTTGTAASPDAIGVVADLLGDSRAVLKAVADAAAGDEGVEEVYRAFMHDYWIDDIATRITQAQAVGLGTGLDAQLAGEALGWMAERLVTQTLDRDPRQVFDTIISILVKCIYTGPQAPAAVGAAPPSVGSDAHQPA